MHKLTGWTARRSGPAMTLTADGGARVPNVRSIECRDGKVIATDVGHQEFELRVGGARDPLSRIEAILNVGSGDPERDAALAASKISDIRMLLDSIA